MTPVTELLPMPKLKMICSEYGLNLTPEQENQFLEFRTALYEQNNQKNFTRVPYELCETRHFAESLLIVDLIPYGASVLDMGTGPGLPAAPLAIARPDLKITAVDSNGKMIGFLKEFGLPNITTINARVEELNYSEDFDIVTGRAFAPLGIFMEVASRPCKVGGRILPFRSSEEDLKFGFCDELGLRQTGVLMRNVGDGMPDRAFPIFEKIVTTPIGYPRLWAKIKAKPLGGAKKPANTPKVD